MCFSTAASRLASEFAVVESDVAADARGLVDDGSEVCAMALPNTNVDTRTAAITFIRVSMGDMHSCEALEQGSSQSHRYLGMTITQCSARKSKTKAQSAIPIRLQNTDWRQAGLASCRRIARSGVGEARLDARASALNGPVRPV